MVVFIPTPTPTPEDVHTAATQAVKITGQSGVEITFTNPRWVNEAGGFHRPNGERWLAVDVAIHNPQENLSVNYSPLWFALTLQVGERILPVPLVGSTVVAQTEIPAGGSLSGMLVFAIPQAKPVQQVYTLAVQDAPLTMQQPVSVTVQVGEGK